MATTTSNDSIQEEGTNNSLINPIPTSVIIVNESTPLLSQEQHLASGVLHTDTKFHISSCLSLSNVEEIKEKELVGLFLLLISSLLFTGVSVLVKLLDTLPSFEIVLARSSVQLPLGLVMCYCVDVNPLGKKGVRKWLLFRAIVSTIALSLYFYSLTKLPLIDATVIFFLGPIFKVLIAALLYNETCSILDGLYSLFCFLGLILVSKPSFLLHQQEAEERQRVFAILCALTAAFMSALAYIMVRKVGQGTHLGVHIVYFGFVASVLSSLGLFVFHTAVWPSSNDFKVYLSSVGVLAFLGQYFLNKGLKLAPSGPVTVIRTSDVLFAFLFGVALFKEIPRFYTLIGTLLIVTMISAMSMHQWHRQELRTAAIKRRKSKEKLISRQQQQQSTSSATT